MILVSAVAPAAFDGPGAASVALQLGDRSIGIEIVPQDMLELVAQHPAAQLRLGVGVEADDMLLPLLGAEALEPQPGVQRPDENIVGVEEVLRQTQSNLGFRRASPR